MTTRCKQIYAERGGRLTDKQICAGGQPGKVDDNDGGCDDSDDGDDDGGDGEDIPAEDNIGLSSVGISFTHRDGDGGDDY